MKTLFKNKTKYTKTVYDQFLAFHSKKYHFTYTAYTAIVIALILQVNSHNYTLAILLCFGLTAFILWRLFRPISEVTKEYKSEKIQKEKEFTFTFYDKFFIIEDEKEFSKIKYYQLYKAFETKKFFYLYLDKTHSFLLDKSTFKKNNPSAFSQFIKKKCWWGYHCEKEQKEHD